MFLLCTYSSFLKKVVFQDGFFNLIKLKRQEAEKGLLCPTITKTAEKGLPCPTITSTGDNLQED